MVFRFLKVTNWVDMPWALTVILYDPRTASANTNSSMGVTLSNISRAPVEMPEKADQIISKQVSAPL